VGLTNPETASVWPPKMGGQAAVRMDGFRMNLHFYIAFFLGKY
jgi:hypothetical protein